MDGGGGGMIASSQSFKDVMIQEVATLYSRVDLLDKNENLIDRIETKVEDGSISVDKERDVRRQFNLTLDNTDNDLTWSVGGRIWLDKRIKLHIGLQTPSGIEYVPQGVFLLSSPSAGSRANGTRQAVFQGGDKWKLFDGQPLGKFTLTTTIAAGVNIGDAIRTIASDGGETKFAFDSCTVVTPYSLTYHPGEPRGKAMKELADLAVFSLFYDVDGYLRFRPKNQDLTKVASVWTYDKSDFTLYAGSDKELDADGLFNKVLVIGGSSQTGTVSATAINSDVNSPISTANISGRLYIHNNGSPDPLITTVALAQARADYELDRLSKIVERQRFEAMPNYLHEAEDVITIVDDWINTNDKYELLRFNLSLKPGAMMTGEAIRVRKVGS